MGLFIRRTALIIVPAVRRHAPEIAGMARSYDRTVGAGHARENQLRNRPKRRLRSICIILSSCLT